MATPKQTREQLDWTAGQNHAALPQPTRHLDGRTATGLVVASMVGAGVFTTSGKLLELVPSPGFLLLAWLVSGIAALCGALVYAELAVALAENGGEYHLLSRLVSRRVGFVSAWCTLVVGFAAPVAAVALAFGSYLQALLPAVRPVVAAAVLVALASLLNGLRLGAMSRAQNLFTFLKLLLIVAFVVLGWKRLGLGAMAGTMDFQTSESGGLTGFAMALLWISFAYTGWNASCYMAGEMKQPGRNLPVALVVGTGLVMVLYLVLNVTFLAAAPRALLKGKLAVGHAAAVALFGPTGGRAMSALIALGLISTVGAMTVTGPRVYEAVGRDFPRLAILRRVQPDKGPMVATWVQSGLALGMLVLVNFDALMVYIGFTLSVFSALTVATVFRLKPEAGRFRTPGYPLTPLIYLALMAWQIGTCIAAKPLSALAGSVTLALGWILYSFASRSDRTSDPAPD